MKKLVLATLLAAATGLASAQTIYGVVDLGVTTATNAKGTGSSVTGVSNGGLSTSRFGIIGGEDLGGGLKASFNLEGEIFADVGSQGGNDLFHRAAFLKLEQAGAGSVRVGRMNRNDYTQAIKYDTFGGNNIGGWIATNSGTVNLDQAARLSNAVEVQTASFGGLTVTGQYGFGEVAGVTESGRTQVIGADYTNGPVSVGATYVAKNATTAGYAKTEVTSVGASYDARVVKVNAGYATTKTEGTSAKPSGYFVGASVPVTGKVTALAQYNKFNDDAGKKPTVYALGATYALSKRTTAYVIGARSDQDGSSAQNAASSTKYAEFVSPTAGLNQTVASVGIRHTF